jgi:hypothetical protein
MKGNAMAAYTLPDDKQIAVKISYVDKRGNPTTIDGNVAWTTADEMTANVGVMAGDSTRAQIIPGANLGQTQITASADADLGEGVNRIITTFDVNVVAGTAVSGTIAPEGDPQPFPGAATGPSRRS